MKRFTTKRAESQMWMHLHLAEASAGRKTALGFTLIEALVAVTILTLAVAGPLFTANRAIVSAQTAKDQLTALYLAQEGIEYVRAMRDREYLLLHPGDTSAAWNNFLGVGAANGIEDHCLSTNRCSLDPLAAGGMGYGTGSALRSYASTATVPPLYLTSGNRYTQQATGNTVTPFTRTIQVVRVSASDERLTVRVSWVFHGTTYSVTVSDTLTPWQ